jgi:hypothetical protein
VLLSTLQKFSEEDKRKNTIRFLLDWKVVLWDNAGCSIYCFAEYESLQQKVLFYLQAEENSDAI